MLKKKKPSELTRTRRSEDHRNVTRKYGAKGLLITDLANGERILSQQRKLRSNLICAAGSPKAQVLVSVTLGSESEIGAEKKKKGMV